MARSGRASASVGLPSSSGGHASLPRGGEVAHGRAVPGATEPTKRKQGAEGDPAPGGDRARPSPNRSYRGDTLKGLTLAGGATRQGGLPYARYVKRPSGASSADRREGTAGTLAVGEHNAS